MRHSSSSLPVRVLSVALLCTLSGIAHGQGTRPGRAATSLPLAPAQLTLPADAFASFAPGVPSTIDLSIEEDGGAVHTRRERLDQTRDWLLLTVLSDSRLPPETLNSVLFDLPAVRRGFLRPVANYEYGETRSRFVGDDKVVALVPVGAGPARADMLAHIADEHRKNNGEAPRELLVFEYAIDLPSQSAQIVRRETVDAGQLFTEQGGYYEARIGSLADLTRFLGRIDDLTHARTSGGLILGGRKLKGGPYRGVTVEDVAAIWISERNITQRNARFESRITEAEERFRSAWQTTLSIINNLAAGNVAAANANARQLRNLANVPRPQDAAGAMTVDYSELLTAVNNLISAYSRNDVASAKRIVSELERVQERQLNELSGGVIAEAQKNPVEDSGFSLDPAYDFENLSVFFDKTESLLRGARLSALTPSEIKQIKDGLRERDELPLLRAVKKLRESDTLGGALIGEILNKGVESHKYQVARYDGDLQGTEVGMTLFYTDLLAKLWDFDFQNSAPREVPGFKPETEVKVSPAHEAEIRKFSYARLWFGQDEKGYQIGDGGASLLFARNSTRLFAKSSDPLAPRAEVESDASTDAFISWWDDRFEEVARHEPQYERLNEVIKWSLLVSWLNNAGQGGQLGFLGDVPVDRSNWFPEWVKRHPELKFKQWDKVGFFPRGHMGLTTETLPILKSELFPRWGTEWQFSGGVTLPGKSVIRARRALPPSSIPNKLIRRPNIEAVRTAAGQSNIKTVEGTSHALRGAGQERAVLTSTPGRGVARGDTSSVLRQRVPFERHIARRGAGVEFETRVGQAELGRLNVSTSANGFKVSWQSRDVDVAQTLARRVSAHPRPAELLATNPNVKEAVRLQSGAYMVRLRGGGDGKWVKLTPGASGPPGRGSLFSVADPRRSSKPFEVQWMDNQAARQELARGVYIRRAPPVRPGAAVPVEELQRSSRFILEGQFNKALNHLDELAARHGPSPDLSLHEGMAHLLRGRVAESARAFSKAVGRTPADEVSFFNEVNLRLSRGGLVPRDASFSFVPGRSEVSLVYKLPAPRGLEQITRLPAKARRALLYVQDSPSLSSIDWPTSVTASLRHVISRKLGVVYKLPRADIARFRPARIVTEDGLILKAVSQSRYASDAVPGPRLPWPIVLGAGLMGDGDDDEEEEEEQDVYFVVPTAR